MLSRMASAHCLVSQFNMGLVKPEDVAALRPAAFDPTIAGCIRLADHDEGFRSLSRAQIGRGSLMASAVA
jgi:hypothetical protein